MQPPVNRYPDGVQWNFGVPRILSLQSFDSEGLSNSVLFVARPNSIGYASGGSSTPLSYSATPRVEFHELDGEERRRYLRPRKRQDTVKAVDTSYPPSGVHYLANIPPREAQGDRLSLPLSLSPRGCVSMSDRCHTLGRGERSPPGARLS